MAIRYPITLSTTEPNNDVGLLKIRQADEETQTLVVEITENSLPKSYEGLQVFFCAKLGQSEGLGIVEQKLKPEEMTDPKNGKLEYTMRAEDWQQIGRQTAYFSFRKMTDDHTYVQQFSTRDFYYNVLKNVFSDGVKEVKKDGSTYVWTIEDLIRLFNEYIASGKTDWEQFVEDNREILESVDPGGKIITELIDARRPFGGEVYPTLGERLDSEKAEVTAQLAQIATNVRTFGAMGDKTTDDREAIQNAVNHMLTTGKKGYLPRGVYFLSSPIKVTNEQVNAWRTFELEGEASGSAVSSLEEYGHRGTVIVTNGTPAFELEFYNYWNESAKFRKISFVNIGVKADTVAVHYKFQQTTYARKQLMYDCNFVGYEDATKFSGYSTSINANYFGTTLMDFCHTYQCTNSVHFDNVFANLFTIDNSLFHGGGIKFSNKAGGYPILRSTHFEGIPQSAILVESSTHIKIVLDGVSAENCGTSSGYGFIRATNENNINLELYISNANYPFALMPTMYNLPRGTVVNSTVPIRVAGESIIIQTPDTVTPVVSEVNPFSLMFTRPHQKQAYVGEKVFNNLTGNNANSSITVNSGQLPDNLKGGIIGCYNNTIINNQSEEFIAPSDGYIYVSWLGQRNTTENGFNVANIYINGERVEISTGYRWKAWEGIYTLVIPIKDGDVLGNTTLTLYDNGYKSPAFVSFSPIIVRASSFNGFPRKVIKNVLIPANSSYSFNEFGGQGGSFAVNVSMLLNNGADGVYQFISRGRGSNSTRNMTTILNSLSTGVEITEDTPLHTHLYAKTINNLSGNEMNVNIEIEYLS